MPSSDTELPLPIRSALGKDGALSKPTLGEKWREHPNAAEVVMALQGLEKLKPEVPCTYEEMLGTWRLRFVTGTKKARESAAKVLSSGRFLPKWVTIQLRYTQEVGLFELSPATESDNAATISGVMENSVKLGGLELTLTGPVQFYGQRQILAFDFTRLQLKLFQRSIYQGFIRGGKAREASFLGLTLKKQAFFKYFLIHPDCIAARGREGGLALWVRAV